VTATVTAAAQQQRQNYGAGTSPVPGECGDRTAIETQKHIRMLRFWRHRDISMDNGVCGQLGYFLSDIGGS
jgi:hypothetical protein